MGRQVQSKGLVMASETKIIGPFSQIITMAKLPLKGATADEQLEIINDGAVAVGRTGSPKDVDTFQELRKKHSAATIEETEQPSGSLPGFVDCHTYLAFGRSGAQHYPMRVAG